MTVTYHHKYSSTTIHTFLKLLLRWRGSVYKLLYKELSIYLVLYSTISVLYRFALTDAQKDSFEKVALLCKDYEKGIPITFLLGLYINFVVGRWWDQLKHIPWPDGVANTITSVIPSCDAQTKLIRSTIVRYLVLALAIRLRDMGTALKSRYPDMNAVMKEGLMTERELKLFEATAKQSKYVTHWIPLCWVNRLVVRALDDRFKASDQRELMKMRIVKEVNEYGRNLRMLFLYGKVPVPLVYTQVVTIAVYTYFAALLMARQYLDPKKKIDNFHNAIDLYIPFFTILEYLFFVGWLKVAEAICNPFGDDDEDFDCHFFIDRHLAVCSLSVANAWEWCQELPLESPTVGAQADLLRSNKKFDVTNGRILLGLSANEVIIRPESLAMNNFALDFTDEKEDSLNRTRI